MRRPRRPSKPPTPVHEDGVEPDREAGFLDGRPFPPLPALPDTSGWPVLSIHLDVKRALAGKPALSFRLPEKARWHGTFGDMDDVMREAHARGHAPPAVLDFVEKRT